MPKLQHNRAECIGCGACEAIVGELFKMAEDGKVMLQGGNKTENETYERDIDEKDVQKAKEAAESCPVDVIKVIE